MRSYLLTVSALSILLNLASGELVSLLRGSLQKTPTDFIFEQVGFLIVLLPSAWVLWRALKYIFSPIPGLSSEAPANSLGWRILVMGYLNPMNVIALVMLASTLPFTPRNSPDFGFGVVALTFGSVPWALIAATLIRRWLARAMAHDWQKRIWLTYARIGALYFGVLGVSAVAGYIHRHY